MGNSLQGFSPPHWSAALVDLRINDLVTNQSSHDWDVITQSVHYQCEGTTEASDTCREGGGDDKYTEYDDNHI